MGVILEENLTWKSHNSEVQDKISKNIGILYIAKPLLDFYFLKSIYFSFINSYVNYATITWSSTHNSKLSKIKKTKQKYTSCIILGEDRFTQV